MPAKKIFFRAIVSLKARLTDFESNIYSALCVESKLKAVLLFRKIMENVDNFVNICDLKSSYLRYTIKKPPVSQNTGLISGL